MTVFSSLRFNVFDKMCVLMWRDLRVKYIFMMRIEISKSNRKIVDISGYSLQITRYITPIIRQSIKRRLKDFIGKRVDIKANRSAPESNWSIQILVRFCIFDYWFLVIQHECYYNLCGDFYKKLFYNKWY